MFYSEVLSIVSVTVLLLLIFRPLGSFRMSYFPCSHNFRLNVINLCNNIHSLLALHFLDILSDALCETARGISKKFANKSLDCSYDN